MNTKIWLSFKAMKRLIHEFKSIVPAHQIAPIHRQFSLSTPAKQKDSRIFCDSTSYSFGRRVTPPTIFSKPTQSIAFCIKSCSRNSAGQDQDHQIHIEKLCVQPFSYLRPKSEQMEISRESWVLSNRKCRLESWKESPWTPGMLMAIRVY